MVSEERSVKEAEVIRVLFADDQLADDATEDSDVVAWARAQYPKLDSGRQLHQAICVDASSGEALRE
jgi:hypothetical protein